MVKVASPGVTPTDKQKCLAAVQKRGELTEPSSNQGSNVDKKPVISVSIDGAKAETVADVPMSYTDSHSKDSENKVRIKIEPVEQMDTDDTKSGELVQTESDVNMKNDSGLAQNLDKLEVTDIKMDERNEIDNQKVAQSKPNETGSGAVSETKMETGAHAVCEVKVQAPSAVSNETDGTSTTEGTSETATSTEAQSDITQPLTIQTKFAPNTSPGKPGLEVIKLEFILRLKIKRNDCCLRTRVCKQPLIALYFESETVLKFYNLEAWFSNPLYSGRISDADKSNKDMGESFQEFS